MIYKLHYFLLAAGVNAISILLGVFLRTYSDASTFEIGVLLSILPFSSNAAKGAICSLADRRQSHRIFLIIGLLTISLTYMPFLVIPFLGENFYREHGRLCWYTMASCKIIGSCSLASISSIGDTLAINYARRIGTKFSVYRVWGTVSWLSFGLIVAQINEVSFLPKYVPGFMILTSSTAIDALLIWLWPPEYFRIEAVASDPDDSDQTNKRPANQLTTGAAAFSKSLMPRQEVWAHAKRQLASMFTFWIGCCQKSKASDSAGPPIELSAEDKADKVRITLRQQLLALWLLLRADYRIILYLLLFSAAGMCMSSIGFFFMCVAERCTLEGSCNFSQLAGYIQATMSSMETILFFYIEDVIACIGRLNVASLAFLITALRYGFYGTVWYDLDPHYSLLVEMAHGIIYTVALTLMVNMAHLFSNEVRYIIPELMERKIIKSEAEAKAARLCLAASMQALVAICFEGLGTGVSAICYGFIIDHYSYQLTWIVVSVACLAVSIIILVATVFEKLFKPTPRVLAKETGIKV